MRRLPVMACLVLACAHRPAPPPLEGWRELRSVHFRLRTDLPEESARATLEKLETLRWWLQAAWSTGGDSPGTTQAIVLADPAELRTFSEVPGIASTTREGPLLVTAGTETLFGDRSPELGILAHEVAHELIRRRMPGAPRWFHEGLAGYLETVVALDDHRVRFGVVRMSGGGLPPPRRLLSLDETAGRRWETASEAEVADLYLSARRWVGLLRAEEPVRMRMLEAALAAGAPWRAAWAELRASLDLSRLQDMMWRLLQAGGWPTEVRAFTPLVPATARPAASRLLSPWEIHLSLAELRAMAAQAREEPPGPQVRAELEAAVAAAPDEPLPRIRLADLERDPDRRREDAELLVQRFPRSPEARVFLARVLRDDGGPLEGRQGAALAAVTAAPDDVDALTAHAIEEARAGNSGTALRSVARAEELEPWNPAVFVARALVLASSSRCDEAVDAVQRALDVLPDDPPAGDVQALVRERERIATTCRARAGP